MQPSADAISPKAEAEMRRTRKLLGWSLFLHLLAAFCSYGFQNSDEHFQILEFLNYRLGLGPGEWTDLPVEYPRQLRHWFQPMLYAGPILFLRAIGIDSPFTWALSARLMTGLIGWASLVALARCLPRWFVAERSRTTALACLCLIWFMPALHARHSSESLSASLMALAVAAAVFAGDGRARLAVLSGWLAGLAFAARFGVAFMVLAVGLWFLFPLDRSGRLAMGAFRARFRLFSAYALGGAISVVMMLILDRWGYGQWTYPAWNYYAYHAHEGHAVLAGVSPWWDYFRRVWTEAWPVLTFAALVASMMSWVIFPFHLLSWVTAFFFLGHMGFGHKEMRFLYPMGPFVAIQCAMVYLWARDHAGNARFGGHLLRGLVRGLVWGLVGFNFLSLVLMSVAPAWAPIRFYEAVWERRSEIQTLHVRDRDPYLILGIAMNFYRPRELQVTQQAGVGQYWFAHNESLHGATEEACVEVARTLPRWVPREGGNNWTLYRCKGAVTPPSVRE
jgi:phosphatidylinositol glycan class B